MNLSEILTNARDRINNGWCKGAYADGEGNYCAMGALGEAAKMQSGLLSDDYARAYTHLNGQLPAFGFSTQDQDVVDFNDDEMTTKQDVLDLFTKAINSALEKGL